MISRVWDCEVSMGSMGEHDRKRRFSSLSPTPATAKKLPFLPVSEDKKVYKFLIKALIEVLIVRLILDYV